MPDSCILFILQYVVVLFNVLMCSKWAFEQARLVELEFITGFINNYQNTPFPNTHTVGVHVCTAPAA